jgi:hypothetical protein
LISLVFDDPPPPLVRAGRDLLGDSCNIAMLCLYTALCLYFLALYVRVTIIISQIYCLFRLLQYCIYEGLRHVVPEGEINTKFVF